MVNQHPDNRPGRPDEKNKPTSRTRSRDARLGKAKARVLQLVLLALEKVHDGCTSRTCHSMCQQVSILLLFIIRYLCTMFYCKNRNVVDENIDEDDDDDDDDVNRGDDYDDVKDDYDDDVDADIAVVMYGYVVERS